MAERSYVQDRIGLQVQASNDASDSSHRIAAFLTDPSRWATTTAEVMEEAGLQPSRGAEIFVGRRLREEGFNIRRRVRTGTTLEWVYFNPQRMPDSRRFT